MDRSGETLGMNSDLPSAVLKVRARLAQPSELLAEVQAATARVVALREEGDKAAVAADGVRLALEELERAQEELRSAQDYLYAQADEISRAATLLEAQRRYYEDLFRNAPDACLVSDPQGLVLDANRCAGELFQTDFNQTRRWLSDFVPADDRPRLLELLKLPASQGLGRAELRVRTGMSETPIVLAASVARAPHSADSAGCLHWILRPKPVGGNEPRSDRSALAQCQSKLESERRAHTQTKAALREHQNLLRMAAHELRTPLSAIMGWTEILASKRADAFGTERIASGLRQSAFVLARVLEDLVDDAQAAHGQLMLEVSRLNLPELVERVLDEKRDQAELRQIGLSAVLDPTLPSLDADPFRLEQVLGNLIECALKFTDPGGALQVRLAHSVRWAELVVRDASHVTPIEPLVSVCDAFVQVQRGEDDALAGLGLDLARRVVELHGGTLSVAQSSSGRSATFTVRLPLRYCGVAQTLGGQPS